MHDDEQFVAMLLERRQVACETWYNILLSSLRFHYYISSLITILGSCPQVRSTIEKKKRFKKKDGCKCDLKTTSNFEIKTKRRDDGDDLKAMDDFVEATIKSW